jgi:hypothetical protein
VSYGFYEFLSHFPPGVALVLLAAVPTIIVVVLHNFFIRLVNPEILIPHREVAGFLVAIVGVIYAVALGFAVITVWVQFNDAQATADTEAGDVGEVSAIAAFLPEPARSRLRSLMADYAFEVRDHEWHMLASGRQDLQARGLLLDAFATLASVPAKESTPVPTESRQSWLRSDALNLLQQLSMDRRKRLVQAEARLQGVLYLALVLGALFVIAFVFLFAVSHRGVQLTMTALVTASMSVLLAVVIELDRPYSGNLQVSTGAWTLVIENNHLDMYRTRNAP